MRIEDEGEKLLHCVHVCVRVKNEDYCFLSANQLVKSNPFSLFVVLFSDQRKQIWGEIKERSLSMVHCLGSILFIETRKRNPSSGHDVPPGHDMSPRHTHVIRSSRVVMSRHVIMS